MRTTSIVFLLLLGLSATAQPGDLPLRFTNPCGFGANDSIDITGDGIHDLLLQGNSSGTDDEPSSSGHCTLELANLPGTGFLSDLDARGYRQLKVVAPGDSIEPLDATRRDDLYIPRLLYADGSIPVADWGYGHQMALFTPVPGLEAQRFVFRTSVHGQLMHGSFTIDPPTRMDHVNIRVDALVPADKPFVVP